ncbi:hypothetical protein POJ06DRAFT_294429 [Lipomyces tetrasporus]|uniref:Potassium channel domain-containing protein n=1 Tax=Lipomyces tetrasporus TaxID=54092 RepID=A0AAD7VUV3_9ASCO|nr:uncharacterized protein POJ06DRAFT_294429 [Lipomyces tetrasporus]KAJ8101635.1 hypothetical protein POJ06DRAFT_294429 [Lipomyces tetrasporus]
MNRQRRIEAIKEKFRLAGMSQEHADDDIFSSLYLEWSTMASSCPLMAAALGPVSNLFSITALAEPWVIELKHGQFDRFHPDNARTIALNAVSLAFGILGNVALLANFTGRVKYSLSQAISITSFYIAGILLLALIGDDYRVYSSLVSDGLVLQFSQGYWSAVITAVLYFLCGFVLTWNLVGHLRGHYPASFILTSSQRSLMLQILCIIIWLAGGGGLFGGIQDWLYGDAVYFCDVTLLTIGFGDFQPTNDLGRALVLPYALIGIFILGLVVCNVRSLVLVSSREKKSLNRVERVRVRNLQRMQLEPADEESFDLMRKIHKSAKKRDMLATLVWNTIIFLIFWLLRLVILHRLYFCSTSLLTIGYGEFVPSLPGSKAFFVLWSLIAVPLLTMLIISMSDTVIAAIVYVAQKLGDVMLKNTSSHLTTEPSQQVPTDLESQKPDEPLSDARNNEIENFNAAYDNYCTDHDNERITKEMLLVDAIQLIVSDMRVDRGKKYSYKEWNMLAKIVDTQFDWLGTDSPIRFPIDEPALFLRLYWNSLKDHLRNKRVQMGKSQQPDVDMFESGAETSKINKTVDAILRATGQEKL